MILMSTALVLAPAPAGGWRLLAGVLAALVAWRPLRAVVFSRGSAAIRRFSWSGEGHWTLMDAAGTLRPACLHPTTCTFGPWILLVWTVSAPGSRYRPRAALIDCAGVGRTAFRALKARLRLAAGTGGNARPDNPFQ